jgi:hypothetical protein
VKNQAWLEVSSEMGVPLKARALIRQASDSKLFGGLVFVDAVELDDDDQVWDVEIVLRRKVKVYGDAFAGRGLDQMMTSAALCIPAQPPAKQPTTRPKPRLVIIPGDDRRYDPRPFAHFEPDDEARP